MESHEGVQLVLNNLTNEVGLSYGKQRDLYAGTGAIKGSYLFDDASFSVSTLLFLSQYSTSVFYIAYDVWFALDHAIVRESEVFPVTGESGYP